MKIFKIYIIFVLFLIPKVTFAQVNAEQVMRVGQNAMYFEDYMLSIQYFNQAINAKPYLAQPYFYRAIAKLNLEDYLGAEEDASKAIELNPFITDAYEVRGVARQNLGNDRDAITDYAHALKLLPNNRSLMFNMALAQENIEDYAAADSTYERILAAYPNYDNAYLGRARIQLINGDTIHASEGIARALEINKNNVNGYVMRADIAIKQSKDYKQALADMNEAIKLQPRHVGFYINRAYLRYTENDFFGAMADYDYAVQLDPVNSVALFNRGLLNAEVNANDQALSDFSKVLEMDPNDYRALYNRAVIYRNKRQYRDAISDISKVIKAFPELSSAYYMRYELYRQLNDLRNAERDYDKAMALNKAPIKKSKTQQGGENTQTTSPEETPDDISRRFASLLTIENDPEVQQEYNSKGIRGKVQDRNVTIEVEPIMELGYYTSMDELKRDTYYVKEVDDLNATRILRFVVVVTNKPPKLTDAEDMQRHFSSIEYYNSYISTHSPRAVDYIGRALDFLTLHNYASAIEDLDRVIDLTPDNAIAYMLRSQARYHNLEAESQEEPTVKDATLARQLKRKAYDDIMSDLDMAIKLSPRSAVVYYNKGNVYVDMQDYTSALSAYGKAIELKSDMGEAYYNRGYVYLKLGNKEAAVADLSKAGEMGVIPAYNLLKRISK